jgi:hypothetical protein
MHSRMSRRPWQLWIWHVQWNHGHTTRHLSRQAAIAAVKRSRIPAERTLHWR